MTRAAADTAARVDAAGIVADWARRWEDSLLRSDADRTGLFTADGVWKDLFVLDSDPRVWRVGEGSIPSGASDLRNWRVHPRRTPPRVEERAGATFVEGFVTFDFAGGTGEGVVRIAVSRDAPPRAAELATVVGDGAAADDPRADRPSRLRAGQVPSDSSAEVLIVGAGQAGLALAARLHRLGVDALVVERGERVGDTWRRRYRSLRLHNSAPVIGLPFSPAPEDSGRYPSASAIGDWLEEYAVEMRLRVWTAADVVSARPVGDRWVVQVVTGAGSKTVTASHVVFATGVSGTPRPLSVEGAQRFRGRVVHSSEFRCGADHPAGRALVVGTGSSAHDIAQDLHGHGHRVTMMQRGPVTVSTPESVRAVLDSAYDRMPQADADLVAASFSYGSSVRMHQDATRRLRERDAELLDSLTAAGMDIDFGEDETGPALKYWRGGGGFYLDAGCSSLIARGDVDILHSRAVACFEPEGVRLLDGSLRRFDLVIAATGFETIEGELAALLGERNARRIGPIWGLDADGFPRNVWRPTPIAGLWFMMGNFAQCRFYSRVLALQLVRRLCPAQSDGT